jgi:hypothetical protein
MIIIDLIDEIDPKPEEPTARKIRPAAERARADDDLSALAKWYQRPLRQIWRLIGWFGYTRSQTDREGQ